MLPDLHPTLIPRHLRPMLAVSLQDSPAVLVTGPRQCGKTTLVKQFDATLPYFTLDDPALLKAARHDPKGFVMGLDRAIIDEVQRAPELLLALKLSIDQDRRPGRFLLTGSANLMALPQMADSLAGRVDMYTLLPFSQSELAQRESSFLHHAVNQSWPLAEPLPAGFSSDLVTRVLTGGYPDMRQRTTPARRQAWARAYMTTLVERDIRDIAQLDQVRQVPHLLAAAAELCGQLVNFAQVGGQIGLNGKTVDKYLGLLEKLYLIHRLPAWSRNGLSRLVKTPKLHFLDAGLQSTLTRLTAEHLQTPGSLLQTRFGATLETWVYGELHKLLSTTADPWFLSHYRDKDQVEVDFVLESPVREVIGIEVKAAASVNASDFKGLQRLRDAAAKQFVSGVLLYNGTHALPFGDGLWAVPLSRL